MARARGTHEAGLALVAASLVLLLASALGDTAFRGLETASLDLRFRIRGVSPAGPETAVVLVDDRSLATLGRWPFSRRVFAKAVAELDRAGAKVIVFDLLFPEPDQPVSAELRAAAGAAASRLPPGTEETLRASLQALAASDPDAEFAAAIRASGRVLLPIAFTFEGPPGEAPQFLADSAYQQFDKTSEKPSFPLRPVAASPPIEALATAASGLGHVNWAYDRDGAPRYDYLALPFEGDFVPSIPVRAAAAWLGIPWGEVALALGEGVRVGSTIIPTDRAMRLLVNYRGPRGTIPTLSFVDLVSGRVPAAALSGRVVIIGASFVGFSDSFSSPFGSTQLPGTERMANLVDEIIHRDFISEIPPLWAVLCTAGVLLLAAATGAGTAILPTRIAALVGVAPLAIWFALTQFAFVHGLWLPMVAPLAALATAMLSVLLFRYWVVDREGRRVRSAFRQYMAPAMVDALAANPERLRLGGETRAMTMLFCDVRGFTSISEQFKSNPQALTHLINRFLTPMTDIIMERRGTIDKYMGDCIMAFWNAPLDDPAHADYACGSALAMIDALTELNDELSKEAENEGRAFQDLAIGIGINTGECVVGNMGSKQRFDYSVLGDAVNLAARLEGQSKTYGVDVVIGEATREAARAWATIELDLIAVKGKTEAVHIYALLGDAEVARSPAFQALAERHQAMLDCYRARDWAGARAALDECRRFDHRLERLQGLYDERVTYYAAHPPGDEWDGVFVATTK